MPKYEGVAYTIGGEEFVVPGLSMRKLRELEADGKLKIKMGTNSVEEIDLAVEVILSAIQRNHSTVTREWLLDNLDTRNVKAITSTVFGLSGLTKVTPGEAGSP